MCSWIHLLQVSGLKDEKRSTKPTLKPSKYKDAAQRLRIPIENIHHQCISMRFELCRHQFCNIWKVLPGFLHKKKGYECLFLSPHSCGTSIFLLFLSWKGNMSWTMVFLSGQKIANGFLVTYYVCAGELMIKYARLHFQKTSSSWHPGNVDFGEFSKKHKMHIINIFSAFIPNASKTWGLLNHDVKCLWHQYQLINTSRNMKKKISKYAWEKDAGQRRRRCSASSGIIRVKGTCLDF